MKLNEPGRQTVDWWDCCGCSVPFYKQIVPTVDTVRYQFLMRTLIESHIPIMLVGPVGTGKTSVAENSLGCQDPKEYTILVINMSARVSQQGASCLSTQAESRLLWWSVSSELLWWSVSSELLWWSVSSELLSLLSSGCFLCINLHSF